MKCANLNCKSTNCVHNKNCECMAGIITIKGADATSPSKTTCATFVVSGGYSFDNLSNYHDNKKTQPDNIRCSARNCMYNENGNCDAERVQILAANASCGTFKYEI